MRLLRKVKRQKQKTAFQKFNTYCSIAFVVLILLTGSVYSVVQVSASQGFSSHTSAWYNVNAGMDNRKADTYPYNSETANVTAVSMDIAYGTTRGLVQYYGEVPYDSCYSGGYATDAFEGIYAQRGTGLHHSETSGWTLAGDRNNVSGGIMESCKNFWGINPINFTGVSSSSNGTKSSNSSDISSTDTGMVTLADLENVNKDNVKSLRLYALSNSGSGSIGFSNFFYMGMNYLAKFVIWILSLIVSAKNIDTGFILTALHLDDLMAKVTSVMIWDSETSKLSIFMGAAIILFIFGIVSFVWKYVKGGPKEQGVLSIVVTALVGMLIIGMCLTGNIASLGSSLSNGVTNIMSTIADAMSGSNSFTNQISDSANENKIAQMKEMALVNKGYIDLQICTQFGVDDINDLRFTNLGISPYSATTDNNVCSHLYGINYGGANTYYEFDNNLGYYFWYADSGASGNKPYRNKEYPETNTAAAEQKLNSMITLLQISYNATSDQAKKDNIKGVILSLAHPNGWAGMLTMLLYTAILILLMMVTWKYALGVLIGKLELFFGLIGFAFAGPMILSGKDKLVKTGRTIMGMVAVAVIEIFFYGVLFDFILFLVSSLLSTNVLQLLVVLGVLLLMLKFNPYIQQKIKELLDNTTRNISPSFANAKNTVKRYARTGMNNAMNNYDQKSKIVGYNEKGEAIRKSNRGNALSQLMHQANNTFLVDPQSHQSSLKIGAQLKEKRLEDDRKVAGELRQAAKAQVTAVDNKIKADTAEETSKLTSAVTAQVNEKYNEKEGIFNIDKLSDAEKASVAEIENLKTQARVGTEQKMAMSHQVAEQQKEYAKRIQALKDAGVDEQAIQTDAQLKQIKDNAKALSDAMAELDKNISKANLDASNKKSALAKQIRENAVASVVASTGVVSQTELDKADGNSLEEKARNAITLKAQNAHKAEMQTALQTAIDATIKTDGAGDNVITANNKVGGRNKVDTARVEQAAVYMQQLSEVDRGVKMSTEAEAKKKTEDAVRKAVEFGETANVHTPSANKTQSITKAQEELARAKSMRAKNADEKRRKAESVASAKAKVEQAKAEAKQNRKDAKAQRDDAYGDYGGTKKDYARDREALQSTRMMSQLQENIMGKASAPVNPKEQKRETEQLDRMDFNIMGRGGRTSSERAERGKSGYDRDEWEATANRHDAQM